MLWIGGDGHCAGSYATNNFSNCENDLEIWWKGRQPHPDNAKINWVTTLANTLKMQFINEGDIRDTPKDILEKGKKFILNNNKSNNIVIVGFSIPQAELLLELSLFLKKMIHGIFFLIQKIILTFLLKMDS